MISNEEESPIEIPHRGALAMLAQLPATGISETECNVLVTIKEKVKTLVIAQKKHVKYLKFRNWNFITYCCKV